MDQQNYNACITANISPKEAFEGISHVSEWWATNFEGRAKNLNDVFTVRFGETFVTFKIVEMVTNKKIVWQVIDCHLPWLDDKSEWKGTKIAWETSTENNLTQISMTHIGLVPEIECYTDCEKGWNFYVKESLAKLLTEHKGLPDTSKNSR
ncbi:MAG: hypothetical protein JWP37_110 [Mucilaginibacter sp.]|nr:hypothetical protein [Mucilaginibacter sp.]